ncbi:MAG TPA: sigma-70 family RNA polymerase sigma factor [Bryobacteraceae bacterium]|nr:sigma-70 family RNA polymerase sigma factor [Bryobacteraceae bacterium]
MGLPHGEITQLLARVRTGDQQANAQLAPLIYDELRRLAAYYIRGERPDHTLQATALVHEAYIKLVGQDIDWQSRAHFFAVAAQVMRRVLVDYARAAKADKRAGKLHRIPLESALVYAEEQSGELIALDEALERLGQWDPRQSRIVELRFFAGLSVEETAEVLGISTRTVKRDWSMARAWLYSELTKVAGNDCGTVGAT